MNILAWLLSFFSPKPVAAPIVTSKAFFEDFNGPAGSLPSTNWVIEVGNKANGELQEYVNDRRTISLDGSSHLAITALKVPNQTVNGRTTEYLSGRICTRGKVDMGYGTVWVRAKLPKMSQGIWPAIWLLGSNIQTAPWPGCGEIDILEMINAPDKWYANVHGGGSNGHWQLGTSGKTVDLSADFHTYWCKREVDKITAGTDSTTFGTITKSMLPAGAQWVFDKPMYLTLNIAVGGNWPGNPDTTTKLPTSMLIDWVQFTPLT